MPRKAFIADVAAASKHDILGVSNVARGDDDEELVFSFTPAGPGQRSIMITARASDLSEYPSQDHKFFLYTEELEDVPELAVISDVLAKYSELTYGIKVPQLLEQTAMELRKALEDGSLGNPISLDEETISNDDPSDNESEDYGDDAWPDDFGTQEAPISQVAPKRFGLNQEAVTKLNRRIRHDMRAVHDAGFYGGILHGMKADSRSSLVSISIRVRKLGLSDEAIQAWDLQKEQYIILLIKFNSFYKTYDVVVSEPLQSHEIEFRVGLSKSRKPTVAEAMAAFSNGRGTNSAKMENDIPASYDKSGFNKLFISGSLNEFMNEQFTSLLKIRHSTGANWDGAKRFLHESQGRAGSAIDMPSRTAAGLTDDCYAEPSSPQKGLPSLVTADHLQEDSNGQLSFPLIATQFLMRYLTRCTEFCLVCHDKTEDNFEALKPYVCSRPLCLYQYMSLGFGPGFGPSVEHEIMTQPYVVDLLISFCYASAKNQRLREYPTGMSLLVPPVNHATFPSVGFPYDTNTQNNQPGQPLDSQPIKVRYDPVKYEIICETDKPLNISSRSWVAIRTVSGGQQFEFHHKVLDVMHPTIRLSPISIQRGTYHGRPQTPARSPSLLDGHNGVGLTKKPSKAQLLGPPSIPAGVIDADLTIYQKNFDDLEPGVKADTIVMLLETIPTVKEMRAFLRHRERHSDPSLVEWNERVSPAALGLLRWIVASNRSCIVQVDRINLQSEYDDDMAIDSLRLDERISGVDGWCQFRFAQGAPDKENRFQQALTDTKSIHSPKYPTLFAWHGSALPNWHSIIRAGLDFKEVKNGRAFGDGCYFSQDHATSLGYSGIYYGATGSSSWPGSELKISGAMCLNEIINAPNHYTSSKPHLVVQHVDWIQTRYLLVKTGDTSSVDVYNQTSSANAVEAVPRPIIEVEQDPSHTAVGPNRKAIGIPRGAFPSSRDLPSRCSDPEHSLRTGNLDIQAREYAVVSDDEDAEDMTFLFSDDEDREAQDKGKGKSRKADHDLIMLDSPLPPHKRPKSMTDFVAGTLDRSSVQLMMPPSYATPSATRQLQRELRTVLTLQGKTPLDELGWYIDQNFVDNVYQWIVEFHSFDKDIPLAKDMKNAGLTSVVLEMRFGKDYPISPPFVRVIRPRFLQHQHGGGGHVTAGGAICMELLTNSGWSAVSSIESVLLQVRMAMSSLDPPGRLEAQGRQQQRDYGIGEAMDAYIRACRGHGWEVPKDFNEFALGGHSI